MEPAVSVRPCLKTHESQTEVHHESTNSLNFCPVIEDEMDEENMDEENRGAVGGEQRSKSGTKKNDDNDIG